LKCACFNRILSLNKGMEPVSRVLPKVLDQVEAHKEFQKEVSAHR